SGAEAPPSTMAGVHDAGPSVLAARVTTRRGVPAGSHGFRAPRVPRRARLASCARADAIRHLACTRNRRRLESQSSRVPRAPAIQSRARHPCVVESVTQRWRWAMMLQHARPFSDVSSPRLDVARIAASAGAIALNVAALLLLLVPAGMPQLTAPDRPGIMVVPIVDRIIPPTPPARVPVTTPRTPVVPSTPALPRPEVAQPVVDQVIVDQGTLPAEEVAPVGDAGPADI